MNAAIAEADALGDTDTVNRLYAMRNDPAAVGRLLLALDTEPDDAAGEARAFSDDAGQYACVMLPLVGDEADAVLALGARVAMRDLSEKGLEYDPHVTALYGLHDGTLPQVLDVAKSFAAIPVMLGRVSVFPATAGKPYDVLKIGVHSPDLHKLNAELRKLPHTSEFPDFKPHVTIGYLKPGRGEAYARKFGNVGKTFTAACLLYSDPLGRESAVPLGATLSFAEWKQGKSPATGEPGWLSDGGQFRKDKPAGSDGEDTADPRKRTEELAGAVAQSLANDPEVKDNPGLLERITDVATTGAAKVLFAVSAIQDHWTGKALGEIVDAYFDNPNDMGKLGYNPGNSAQTASPKVLDPVSGAIQDALGFGMSGHIVAKIAAEVLSRGFLFLRDKVRAARPMDDETQQPRELADVLAKLFDSVNEALGLDGRHDPDEIVKLLVPLMQGAAEAFADWKPGNSATGVAGWVSSGGQWRKDRPKGAKKTDAERGQGSLLDMIEDDDKADEKKADTKAPVKDHEPEIREAFRKIDAVQEPRDKALSDLLGWKGAYTRKKVQLQDDGHEYTEGGKYAKGTPQYELEAFRKKHVAPLQEAFTKADAALDAANQEFRDKIVAASEPAGDITAHGMTNPESMRKVHIGGFDLHFPEMPDTVTKMRVAESVKSLIYAQAWPDPLKQATGSIYLSGQANKHDSFWEQQYGIPGFESAATGGDGHVCVYKGAAIRPSTLAHEAGHNLAKAVFGQTAPTYGTEYYEAQAKEPPVSPYGSKSPAEDFAEACEMYIHDRPTLRRNFPLKAAALDKIMGLAKP